MKTQLTTLVLLLCLSSLFGTGIGIVDGVNGIYLTTIETNTEVRVKDQISITTTIQTLRNDTGEDIKIKYGYPLNQNANPTSLRWLYNNLWNEASVSGATQDNDIPGGGSGGSGNIQPELTTFLGNHPLFFSPKEVVKAGETITFEITYVELLPYFLGKVKYEHFNNFAALQQDPLVSQSFTFILESEKELINIDLFGLIHEVDAGWKITTLTYTSEETVNDFDYIVEYELNAGELGINALSTMINDTLFNCDSLGNGYFSMIVEPVANVNTEVIEKNFSLIIDRSGSMAGDKIVQAKDAATYIVQNLNLGDYFNIIDFSNDVKSLSTSLLEYTPENEAKALAYIDEIKAGGSTNISKSLITSINQFDVVQEDKANIIIFCTDGNATAGETSTSGILSQIKAEINATEKDVFLFTIGIGQDLDKALVTLLARDNKGLAQFVNPATLQEDLVKFFLSINNPILLNTKISFSPDIIKQIYPFPYPNLYKGQQLVLSGRYDTADTVDITLSGKAFNVPVSYYFRVNLSDKSESQLSFLPKLWAKQKLDALATDFYLADSQMAQDAVSAEIDSISKCYGVVAVDFSSFDDNTTEVDEIELGDSHLIDYHPNPFQDEVVIDMRQITTKSEKVFIKILNSSSQEVFSLQTQIVNGKINLSNLGELKHGLYFVVILVDNKQYLIKVVK